MAVDFGDHASGFRHTEVVRFINDEVLVNGGGPDFYAALRSRPWDEVEERLRTVLADPQVPRAMKRACAWSALALSVRVGARQREQQERQVQRLQNQADERETTTWALASELQRLRGERESAVAQLRSTQAALRQTLVECDVLRGRLLQVERASWVVPLARERVPGPPAEPLGAIAWPRNADVVAGELRSRLYFEARVPAPVAVLYVPGPPSPWAQAVQPALPVPVRYLLPFRAPFPVGFPVSPPLPPVVVMDAEAAVVPHQMPPLGIGPPGPRAAVGYQEGMVPRSDQRSCSQAEGPAILQRMVPVGDSWSHSQEEDREMPQGVVLLRDSWSLKGSESQEEGPAKAQGMVPFGGIWGLSQEEGLGRSQEMVTFGASRMNIWEEDPERPQEMGASGRHNQEEDPKRPQVMVPLGASRDHSQEEGPKRPQGMPPLVASRSSSHEEDPERPQEMLSLGASGNYSQEEGPRRPQGTGDRRRHGQQESPKRYPPGFRRSHSLEEGLQRPQATPQGDSWSCGVRESPMKQQPQGQKAKQPKGKKALGFLHQEKSASGCGPESWECPWCKAMNFSWHKACYKCKEGCVEVESGGPDPGPTH
uniref:RanBP2-type domain-containing protein n=1 Tax=Lynx canadensis TaxID=61383 RepID=A0A667J2L1_LYNCA